MATAAVILPAAVLLAAGSGYPATGKDVTAPAAEAVAAPCCSAIVAAPIAVPADGFTGHAELHVSQVAATRLRMVSRFLPAGVAPERGLQVKTIQAARSISDAFPEIRQIGGVRPDGLRWHPNGLALDVMIPNPGTAAGIALGDRIVAYALENAARFGLQDAIWRGDYYTPGGVRRGGHGHYDHVHITTTGGGYPTGAEVYFR